MTEKPNLGGMEKPNLDSELNQFLLRNPELAQELARRTQDLGPKETMAVVAKAMWDSQWASRRPGKQPGQWRCLCGRVISRNKKYCKACGEKEQEARYGY